MSISITRLRVFSVWGSTVKGLGFRLLARCGLGFGFRACSFYSYNWYDISIKLGISISILGFRGFSGLGFALDFIS